MANLNLITIYRKWMGGSDWSRCLGKEKAQWAFGELGVPRAHTEANHTEPDERVFIGEHRVEAVGELVHRTNNRHSNEE